MKNKKNGILHVINSFEVGGAEYLLKNICISYRDDNTEIILAYLSGQGSVLQGIALSNDIYNLSRDGKFTPLCLFSLVKIIKQHNIKILHTHDPQSGIISRLAARVSGIEFIVTTRHNPDLIGNHPFIYKIENYFLRKSDVVIAISESVKRRLTDYYRILPEKVKVIYNGIDISRFDVNSRNSASKQKNEIVIGTIARLTEQKGVDILINAFLLFATNNDNALLFIGGDGPEMDSLKKMVDASFICERVKFLGMIKENEVEQLLKTIDIFVLASRWEGFGISMIEAMAMGKAVIGSNVDGIREIIQHGVNGLLFSKEDIRSLVDQLTILSQDSSFRQKIGKSAQESVRSKFTIERYCEQLIDVYSNLLKTNPQHNGRR